MSFDVSAFRGKLTGDGARPNLFEVSIPNTTSDSFWQGNSEFSFFCKASQIPGITIGTVPVNYFGRQVKLAGNKTYADWTVTVINDESFSHRSQFEAWMNSINTASGNLREGDGGATDYTQACTVTQLSKLGSDTAARIYTLHYTFPTDLSPITLDWGDNDTIEEYTVTFSFDYFSAVSSSTAPKSASGASTEDVTNDGTD